MRKPNRYGIQGENIYDLEKTTLKVIRTLAEKFQEKEPVHSASVKKAIEFIEEITTGI